MSSPAVPNPATTHPLPVCASRSLSLFQACWKSTNWVGRGDNVSFPKAQSSSLPLPGFSYELAVGVCASQSHSDHPGRLSNSSWAPSRTSLQAYLIYWAPLYCASQMLRFLQIEGNVLHQQNDYNLLYYDTLLWWSRFEPAIAPRYACNESESSGRGPGICIFNESQQ